MRQGASGWHPGNGRGMPSTRPHQRTHARVSATRSLNPQAQSRRSRAWIRRQSRGLVGTVLAHHLVHCPQLTFYNALWNASNHVRHKDVNGLQDVFVCVIRASHASHAPYHTSVPSSGIRGKGMIFRRFHGTVSEG